MGWAGRLFYALIGAAMGVIAIWLVTTVERFSLRPSAEFALQRASFQTIEGWRQDRLDEALPAFLRSCEKWQGLPPETPVAGIDAITDIAGTVENWRPACDEAGNVPPNDAHAARRFFETYFAPFMVVSNGETTGLFTGYYEAELTGSPTRTPEHPVPILSRPSDLVMVNLGEFRDELKGTRIAGRVVDGTLRPYPDRKAIEQGAIADRTRTLLWVDDAVDAFFLQIQGSGRVRLPDGTSVRLGYAAQNGHPYTAIGRVLIDRGYMSRDDVSMQSIRRWLAANPEEGREIMWMNRSYVFFEPSRIEDPSLGPKGAQGIPLTPSRSLAVDRKFHALGTPIWLETVVPAPDGNGVYRNGSEQPLRQLMIAQDTGGAIRGAIRGDFFWGFGKHAEERAGRMKSEGQMVVLLPQSIATQVDLAN